MIALAIAQFIGLFVAFVVIKQIGRTRSGLGALDFFIGSLIPIGILVLLVSVNQSFFSQSEKYNSPGTLFWNFVLILPLGILFYYLKKFSGPSYKASMIRIGGILFFLVVQALVYIFIPDFGY